MMGAATPRTTTTLVACNIYVSAGGARPRHAALLLKLLDDAQRRCLRGLGYPDGEGESDGIAMPTDLTAPHQPNHASSASASASAAPALSARVVHAFADRVYDRSSFHLAGAAPAVVRVASHLALEAMAALLQHSTPLSDDDNDDGLSDRRQAERLASSADSSHLSITPQQRITDPLSVCHPHPSVGLVDHIAVMPLLPLDGADSYVGGSDQFSSSAAMESCGWAARQIGQALERHHLDLRVLYYGLAHPDGLSLAQVRREQTSFFNTLSRDLTAPEVDAAPTLRPLGTVTVGAPSTAFGENVNLRLRRSDPAGGTAAKSLARWVRARDGGLPQVEALSLPYSHGRWEVACNLLQPSETSLMDVVGKAREWDAANGNGEDPPLLEKCYRVGTTEQMCFDALALEAAEQVEAHYRSVRDRFLVCLVNDP